MNLLVLSWKNLVSRPLSLLLSLLLFSLGVGLISFLLLLTRQLEEKFSKNLADIDLVIGAKGSPLQLILSAMYHVDAPTGNIPLDEAAPFMNPKHPLIKKAVPLSLGDSYKGYRIVGTTPAFLDLYPHEIAEGKIWENDLEAVIGADVAKKLGLKLGDKFRSSHGLIMDDSLDLEHEGDFTIGGILKPSGSVVDQLLLCNTATIWKIHETHHEHEAESDHEHSESKEITALLVQFRGKNYQALNLQRNINENTNLQAASPAWEMNRLYENIGVGEQALQILALIIILVSGLSVFISLYSSLRERKYELALIRVMGASRGALFLLIIMEGLLIAVLGYLAGIIFSHAAMELLSGALQKAYRYTFSGGIFLKEEWWLLAGAVFIGLMAAVLPALQAQRTDISQTLSEG